MNLRYTISLVATATGLLLAAALTHVYSLWSFLGNYTVPWFCCAVGIALLLVAAVTALTGRTPDILPLSRVLVVVIGSSIAVALGMLVDGISYQIPKDWPASVAEWAGFTIILMMAFWIPRIREKDNAEQSTGADS